MAHIAVLFATRLLRRTVEYDSSPHCSNTHAAYHLCGLATKTGEKVGLPLHDAVKNHHQGRLLLGFDLFDDRKTGGAVEGVMQALGGMAG